ncbi:MAG: hypothetical protein J2P46_15580, partial [Zavarzinella sp.]|nr:hypothetical protein [Zavarzinella sp.]
MRVPPTRLRWGLAVAAVLVLAGGLVLWYRPWGAAGDPPPASPFLNTGPDARYVGSVACSECHADRRASFRATGMGRSMAEVDPDREPPDGVVDHRPSKRRYEVVRKDGRLWHRELLLGAGPPDVVLAEYPVRYVVGSGR